MDKDNLDKTEKTENKEKPHKLFEKKYKMNDETLKAMIN